MEKYRNLPYIGVLKEEAYSRDNGEPHSPDGG